MSRAAEPTYALNDFSRWTPDKLRYDSTMLIIAPTKTGKTCFLIEILRLLPIQRIMALVIGTEGWTNGGWPKHIHPMYLFSALDDNWMTVVNHIRQANTVIADQIDQEMDAYTRKREVEIQVELDAAWKRQWEEFCEFVRKRGCDLEEIKQREKKLRRDFERDRAAMKAKRFEEYAAMRDEKRKKHQVALVIDDIMQQKNAIKHPFIDGLLKAGRHAMFQQYYCVQQILDMHWDRRDQFEWLVIAPKMSSSNIKNILDKWVNGHTFTRPVPQFTKILSAFAAKANTWMIIDRRAKSMDPRDWIYRYTTKPMEIIYPTKIGSPASHYAAELYFSKRRYDQLKQHNMSEMQRIESKTRPKKELSSAFDDDDKDRPAETQEEGEEGGERATAASTRPSSTVESESTVRWSTTGVGGYGDGTGAG